MAVSKADMGEKNPVEYQEGARRAREARSHVADQLTHLIEAGDLTGSHPLVARRIKSYAVAAKTGDAFVIRAALMDVAAAAAATVAAIDLATPQSRHAT